MEKKIKIAVIGCGGISNCHLGGYSRNSNVEIYALCDINRARGELFQARQYLLVLQQNYTLSGDDISTLIAQRLAELDEMEKPIEKEVEDEE